MGNVLSLFSGGGGAVLGFQNAGHNVVGAVDFNEDAVATLRENFPDITVGHYDLTEVAPSKLLDQLGLEKDEIDVVVGGPPCQGFSYAGDRNSEDERNNLVFTFLDYVDYVDPKYFVMENVAGIKTMETEGGELVTDILLEEMVNLGYKISYEKHDAKNFSVPQSRERVIFVGSKEGVYTFPSGSDEVVTVKEALDVDLSDVPNNDQINSSQSTVEKLRQLDYGECPNEGKSPRKLYPNKPAWTLTAVGGFPIHYSEPRKLTRRECAILQSFPKNYKFCGNKLPVQKQIGNAAPPKMVKAVAEQLP